MSKKSVIWLIPVLVLALAMTSCGGDDNDNGGNGDAGMPSLNFENEQVWKIEMGNYSLYNGNNVLTSNAGGFCTIENGKMTFTVDAPNKSLLKPMGVFLTSVDDKFNIFSYAEWNSSIPIPNAMELVFTPSLKKKKSSLNDTITTEETVKYIYVDADCTLKAEKRLNVSIPDVSMPVEVLPLNLKLKQGWNPIHSVLMVSPAGGTVDYTKGDLKDGKWILE